VSLNQDDILQVHRSSPSDEAILDSLALKRWQFARGWDTVCKRTWPFARWQRARGYGTVCKRTRQFARYKYDSLQDDSLQGTNMAIYRITIL